MKTLIKPIKPIIKSTFNTIALDLNDIPSRREKIPTLIVVKVLPKPKTEGKEINIFWESKHPEFGTIYTISILVLCQETRLKANKDQKVQLMAFDDNGDIALLREEYGILKVNHDQLLNIQSQLLHGNTVIAVPRESQYVRGWVNKDGIVSLQLSVYNQDKISFVV